MATISSSPTFTVQRCEPELVTPAKPTPHECKLLSDIDDQESYRFQIPAIYIFQNNPSMRGKDPVRVIREALAKVLVFYYPLAGRLKEGPHGKLMVDCTGEGALFIEANADVSLEELDGALQPPFPCSDQLLYDVPGSQGILNCPLLLVQVTRLNCGGFILATRFNHTIIDGVGIKLFLSAMSDMAHGLASPSILPSWERHLLYAGKASQRVTFTHHEYDQVDTTMTPNESTVQLQRSFFFGEKEISSLRQLLPPHLRQCTKFELLTACLWRCRTIALNLDPNHDVRMMCIVNARSKFNPPLPSGYYGNVFVFPAAKTTSSKLSQNPLGHAVELVRKAKRSVTEKYVRSVASLMVLNGKRITFPQIGSFLISDITRLGLSDVDYGWGKAVFGGAAKAVGPISFLMSANKNGEIGTLVPINLPAPAMERFVKELDNMLKVDVGNYILSSL